MPKGVYDRTKSKSVQASKHKEVRESGAKRLGPIRRSVGTVGQRDTPKGQTIGNPEASFKIPTAKDHEGSLRLAAGEVIASGRALKLPDSRFYGIVVSPGAYHKLMNVLNEKDN